MLRILLALVVLVVPAAAQQVQLPVVPSFELAPSEPGFKNVQELHVTGRKHLDTDVKVKGYIIWIYDCLSGVIQPGETKQKAQRRIDDDPTLCERAKFYLGASKTDPPEKGLWIVDVPRPPNKLERERLPREELAKWPKPPKLKVGDYVIVSGKFTLSSPHSERNSDGLVVFSAIQSAKPLKPPKVTPAATPPQRPAIAAPQIQQVTIKPASDAVMQRSVRLANDGTRAFEAHLYTDAITAYMKAVSEWPGNHIAYYGLAGTHAMSKDWVAARDAAAKALGLQPKQATYAMVYGVALYEVALADAREAQAKRENRKPEEIMFDASTVKQDEALPYLTYATTLDPTLWRAHYYIGRIYRERGEPRWAADSLSKALASSPNDPGPWIALGELYRLWDYADEAIAVAKLGTTIVTKDSTDVWFVLGMAYDDKRKFTESIDAFTHAIDAKRDNAKALFQRGQVHFRAGDFAKAKRDLEAFAANKATNLSFAQQQASKMLMDIAAKTK